MKVQQHQKIGMDIWRTALKKWDWTFEILGRLVECGM